MSDQPRTDDANPGGQHTTERPHDLVEKSLTGSSHSEIQTIQTSDQTPAEFVASDDD